MKTSAHLVIASLALTGCQGSASHLDGTAPELGIEDPVTDETLEPPADGSSDPAPDEPCTSHSDCDDGDPCTNDRCQSDGGCLNAPLDITEPLVIAGPVTLGHGFAGDAVRTDDHVLVSLVMVVGGGSGFLSLYRMTPDLSSIDDMDVGAPSEGMPWTDLAVGDAGPGAALVWSENHSSWGRELSVLFMESWDVHTSLWYDWHGQDVHVAATPSGWFIAYHSSGSGPFDFILTDETGEILHGPGELLSWYEDDRLYTSHVVFDGEHVIAAFEQRTIRTYTELGEQLGVIEIEGVCGQIAGIGLHGDALEVLLVCTESEEPSLYLRRMTTDGTLIEPDIDLSVGFAGTVATGMVDYSLLPTDDATVVAFLLADATSPISMLCTISRDVPSVRCWNFDSIRTPVIAEGTGSSLVMLLDEGLDSPVQAYAVCLPAVEEVGCTSHAECEDDDPCSIDRCVGGDCVHETAPDATPCGEGSVCCDGTCVEGDCCTDDDCACSGTALSCYSLSMFECAGQLGCTVLTQCHLEDMLYPPIDCTYITSASACRDCGCVWLDSCMETSYAAICETLLDADECGNCHLFCDWHEGGGCTGWASPCTSLSGAECNRQAGCDLGSCTDHACTE